MNTKQRNRGIAAVAALLLALVPASAFAHDNVGGDELAAANWMLIGAIITIVIGLIWAVWALRAGQFDNVEQSKYRMLELSEDFDAIMAEADARERVAREAETAAKQAVITARQQPQPTDSVAAGQAHKGIRA